MWCRSAAALARKTADALSVEGWRRGIAHRGAGRVRGASGLSPCAVKINPGRFPVLSQRRSDSTDDQLKGSRESGDGRCHIGADPFDDGFQ
ncbi:hypothetical protein Aph02nite_51740 [Actinoplanes philippinensis]|nr:hypothetical protein Aph02nite_51740 [Actinoplanes philippinensis]